MRCLADLALIDAADAGDGFAEQFGKWVHFADAITLAAVNSEGGAIVPNLQPASLPAALAAVDADVRRVQAMLTQSITQSLLPGAANPHLRLPTMDIELPLKFPAAYAPFRRFHEAHQRDMEARIQPLRAKVRQAVANASPALRKLADLDATFEKILRDRESKLLGRVPLLLGRRFEQLYKARRQRIEADQEDDPATWNRPEGWLARFSADLQTVLLAELELRLQPTLGLLEAIRQDTQSMASKQ